MQQLIDYIKQKRMTHFVDYFTLNETEFFIRWAETLKPGAHLYVDQGVIRDLQKLADRGFEVCVEYNELSTRGVFAQTGRTKADPKTGRFEMTPSKTVQGLIICKDCKDGYYYPLIGPREPCRTCTSSAMTGARIIDPDLTIGHSETCADCGGTNYFLGSPQGTPGLCPICN